MRLVCPILTGLLLPPPAFAQAAEEAAHADPIAGVLLSLSVVLLGAKLGGHLATRFGQPGVLGELMMGVIFGNLSLFGFTALDYLKTDPSIDMLSKVGVILLLFMVGLESTVAQMLKVGWSSFLVACLGVIGPFILGWGVGAWLLPEHSSYTHAFIGAALTATSVGITARVLKDLGRSQTTESRIILGAAVIDDVLGLLILAVVGGIITAANAGGTMSFGEVGITLLKAGAFLIGSLFIGVRIAPRMFTLSSKLHAQGVLLAVGLSFCFILAYLANLIGLAPIVGAFAAGLILEEVNYRDFVDRGEHPLEQLVEPLVSFLAPVFFVVMGMRTDLRSFTDIAVLGLAAALCVAAVLGKLLAMFGVLEKGLGRLSIGIGMIPRGEVGLIFANIGLTLVLAGERIVDQSSYSAVVVMVIVTTMATPPLLKWSLSRNLDKRTVGA
jgi:Kef-type K+ transport system membrane component KefB